MEFTWGYISLLPTLHTIKKSNKYHLSTGDRMKRSNDRHLSDKLMNISKGFASRQDRDKGKLSAECPIYWPLKKVIC